MANAKSKTTKVTTEKTEDFADLKKRIIILEHRQNMADMDKEIELEFKEKDAGTITIRKSALEAGLYCAALLGLIAGYYWGSRYW